MSRKIRAHLTLSGRVQGVCFRMVTQEEAQRLGLTGWVRNLPTGQVEVVAEGEEAAMEELIAWCHKGPPGARVAEVKVQREPYGGDLQSFKIV